MENWNWGMIAVWGIAVSIFLFISILIFNFFILEVIDIIDNIYHTYHE